ncbi:unnamed protein product, partial [Ascophyllum nodosum]
SFARGFQLFSRALTFHDKLLHHRCRFVFCRKPYVHRCGTRPTAITSPTSPASSFPSFADLPILNCYSTQHSPFLVLVPCRGNYPSFIILDTFGRSARDRKPSQSAYEQSIPNLELQKDRRSALLQLQLQGIE